VRELERNSKRVVANPIDVMNIASLVPKPCHPWVTPLRWALNDAALRATLLLLALLPDIAIADDAIPRTAKHKPEVTVVSLMEFDFAGGYREAPETYPAWFPLTTDGIPDPDTSYYACEEIAPIIHSYRILETDLSAPDKASVHVEVEVLGFYASRIALGNDKCYWPDLGLTIHENVTAKGITVNHAISVSNFIEITAGTSSDELFNEFQGDETSALPIVVRVAKEGRLWRYHVPLVFANGEWLVLSELLPPAMPSLKVALKRQEEAVARFETNSKICGGMITPNHAKPEYYKQFICPPHSHPEKLLSHGLKNLAILRQLKREN